MDLECPRCEIQLSNMKFEDLDQGITFSQMLVDKCESCGGVWFDKGELEQVDEIVDITLVEIRKIPNSREQNKPLNCPKCKTRVMDKIHNERDKKVIMDVCSNCKGIWLDAGELEAIQKENLFKSFFNIVGWIIKS